MLLALRPYVLRCCAAVAAVAAATCYVYTHATHTHTHTLAATTSLTSAAPPPAADEPGGKSVYMSVELHVNRRKESQRPTGAHVAACMCTCVHSLFSRHSCGFPIFYIKWFSVSSLHSNTAPTSHVYIYGCVCVCVCATTFPCTHANANTTSPSTQTSHTRTQLTTQHHPHPVCDRRVRDSNTLRRPS